MSMFDVLAGRETLLGPRDIQPQQFPPINPSQEEDEKYRLFNEKRQSSIDKQLQSLNPRQAMLQSARLYQNHKGDVQLLTPAELSMLDGEGPDLSSYQALNKPAQLKYNSAKAALNAMRHQNVLDMVNTEYEENPTFANQVNTWLQGVPEHKFDIMRSDPGKFLAQSAYHSIDYSLAGLPHMGLITAIREIDGPQAALAFRDALGYDTPAQTVGMLLGGFATLSPMGAGVKSLAGKLPYAASIGGVVDKAGKLPVVGGVASLAAKTLPYDIGGGFQLAAYEQFANKQLVLGNFGFSIPQFIERGGMYTALGSFFTTSLGAGVGTLSWTARQTRDSLLKTAALGASFGVAGALIIPPSEDKGKTRIPGVEQKHTGADKSGRKWWEYPAALAGGAILGVGARAGLTAKGRQQLIDNFDFFGLAKTSRAKEPVTFDPKKFIGADDATLKEHGIDNVYIESEAQRLAARMGIPEDDFREFTYILSSKNKKMKGMGTEQAAREANLSFIDRMNNLIDDARMHTPGVNAAVKRELDKGDIVLKDDPILKEQYEQKLRQDFAVPASQVTQGMVVDRSKQFIRALRKEKQEIMSEFDDIATSFRDYVYPKSLVKIDFDKWVKKQVQAGEMSVDEAQAATQIFDDTTASLQAKHLQKHERVESEKALKAIEDSELLMHRLLMTQSSLKRQSNLNGALVQLNNNPKILEVIATTKTKVGDKGWANDVYRNYVRAHGQEDIEMLYEVRNALKLKELTYDTSISLRKIFGRDKKDSMDDVGAIVDEVLTNAYLPLLPKGGKKLSKSNVISIKGKVVERATAQGKNKWENPTAQDIIEVYSELNRTLKYMGQGKGTFSRDSIASYVGVVRHQDVREIVQEIIEKVSDKWKTKKIRHPKATYGIADMLELRTNSHVGHDLLISKHQTPKGVAQIGAKSVYKFFSEELENRFYKNFKNKKYERTWVDGLDYVNGELQFYGKIYKSGRDATYKPQQYTDLTEGHARSVGLSVGRVMGLLTQLIGAAKRAGRPNRTMNEVFSRTWLERVGDYLFERPLFEMVNPLDPVAAAAAVKRETAKQTAFTHFLRLQEGGLWGLTYKKNKEGLGQLLEAGKEALPSNAKEILDNLKVLHKERGVGSVVRPFLADTYEWRDLEPYVDRIEKSRQVVKEIKKRMDDPQYDEKKQVEKARDQALTDGSAMRNAKRLLSGQDLELPEPTVNEPDRMDSFWDRVNAAGAKE